MREKVNEGREGGREREREREIISRILVEI
jgi:hypothetical protein